MYISRLAFHLSALACPFRNRRINNLKEDAMDNIETSSPRKHLSDRETNTGEDDAIEPFGASPELAREPETQEEAVKTETGLDTVGVQFSEARPQDQVVSISSCPSHAGQ